MRAIDPRLLRYGRATRRYLVVAVVVGAATAALVVAQAWTLASVVSGAFSRGEGLGRLVWQMTAFGIIVVLRSLVAWASEIAANRSSARAKSELRMALLDSVAARAGSADAGPLPDAGALATLASRGVDALDAYFSRYLPQLVLAVLVPLVVLGVVADEDWVSALLIAATVPLIPLFMALIGLVTRDRTERQFRSIQRLAGHFLDVVSGLPTLKVFGRAQAQAGAIKEVTERVRSTTMNALRTTFLSSLVLELLSTISVALVAVAVGLRLLGGHLGFRTALFVLVLAPEAYLPLRLLGANFHASAEGTAAAEQVFVQLEQSTDAGGAPPTSRRPPADLRRQLIAVDALIVQYPDRREPAIERLSLTVEAGEAVALVGPSGCGKSTLLGVLLGLVAYQGGSVSIGGVDLQEIDLEAWRRQIAWVPQRPHIFAASVNDNVALGQPDASETDVGEAIARAGLGATVARLPHGARTELGQGGAGLSAGERQRIALARAFLRDAPVMLLDEPTAALDGSTEREVLDALQRLRERRTVITAAHRPSLVAMADRVVSLSPAAVAL